jgi:choline dehydrogenase-like flavoprotein
VSADIPSAFDYIVIGAGTAGCVLAARLSENAAHSVCLIEAGRSEQHPYIRIPAAVRAAIMSPRFGWGLMTTPQSTLGAGRCSRRAARCWADILIYSRFPRYRMHRHFQSH